MSTEYDLSGCACCNPATVVCGSTPDVLQRLTKYVKATYDGTDLLFTVVHDGLSWRYTSPSPPLTICGDLILNDFQMTCTATPGLFTFGANIRVAGIDQDYEDVSFTNDNVIDDSPFHMTVEIDSSLITGVNAGCASSATLFFEMKDTPFV